MRDSRHNVIQYGYTKSHLMRALLHQERSSASAKAVVIIVIIIIVLLSAILVLLYYKRREVTDYLMERKKAKAGVEFAEYPTKGPSSPPTLTSWPPWRPSGQSQSRTPPRTRPSFTNRYSPRTYIQTGSYKCLFILQSCS